MGSLREFLQGIRVQGRVIYALLLWEVITRYGRDNLGFLWLFLEPMIFTISVTALWFGIGMANHSTLPIVAFAMTGYSSVLLWRNCVSRCSMAIPSNIGLLYHKPVRPLDILIARSLLEVAGASISFLALSVLWISIEWASPPDDISIILGGWFLLTWFSLGLGLAMGALTSMSDIAERLWHPVAYILFPISGAAFMVDWLAEGFRDIILLLPMVHCVEIVREGFFGSVVRTHYDVGYVAMCSLVMTALGLGLTRIASRRLQFR
jgi:capsular polysaccharide transport system permease protein